MRNTCMDPLPLYDLEKQLWRLPDHLPHEQDQPLSRCIVTYLFHISTRFRSVIHALPEERVWTANDAGRVEGYDAQEASSQVTCCPV